MTIVGIHHSDQQLLIFPVSEYPFTKALHLCHYVDWGGERVFMPNAEPLYPITPAVALRKVEDDWNASEIDHLYLDYYLASGRYKFRKGQATKYTPCVDCGRRFQQAKYRKHVRCAVCTIVRDHHNDIDRFRCFLQGTENQFDVYILQKRCVYYRCRDCHAQYVKPLATISSEICTSDKCIKEKSVKYLLNSIHAATMSLGIDSYRVHIPGRISIGMSLNATDFHKKGLLFGASHIHITFQCHDCGTPIDRTLFELKRGRTCPCRSRQMSYGALAVKQWLTINRIPYEAEYTLTRLGENRCRYRFDYYVETHRIAIEYDGPQHTMPIPLFGGEAGFVETRERDTKKDAVALKHGIRIIRVPYNTDDIFGYLDSAFRQLTDIQLLTVETEPNKED